MRALFGAPTAATRVVGLSTAVSAVASTAGTVIAGSDPRANLRRATEGTGGGSADAGRGSEGNVEEVTAMRLDMCNPRTVLRGGEARVREQVAGRSHARGGAAVSSQHVRGQRSERGAPHLNFAPTVVMPICGW